jgi:hypothetical protein
MKLKAATYNLQDGKVVKSEVEKSMIFDEKVTTNYRKLKISFPDVREGSIIEYTYKRNGGSLVSLFTWYFQTTVPVMHSEYYMRIPNFLSYKTIYGGYESIDIANHKSVMEQGGVQSIEHHWVMKDIPVLKEEPYMPDMSNYYSRVEFELSGIDIPGQMTHNYLKSWPDFQKTLIADEDFYKVTNKCNFLKDSVKRIVEGKEGIDRVRAIHDFVVRHVKWNKKERRMASSSPKQIYREGIGNSADINLMYTGLLRLAEVEAYPVILGTRSNGIIRNNTRPVSSQYNYTIACAKVGDKEYLLDATDPYLPFTLLPVRCINGQGRLIKPIGSKWVSLVAEKGYNQSIVCQMEINEEGNLTGYVSKSSKGYPARHKMVSIEDKGLDKYIEDVKKNRSDWNITKYEVVNAQNGEKPFTEKIYCSIEGRVDDMGGIMILNPLLGSKWEENPFKGEKRVFPIDFITKQSDRFVLSFKIPEGYTVDELPESVRITTPDKGITYTYRISTSPGQIVQILSSLKINKPMFTQNEFQDLKKFFEFVREKQSEQIVLKRAI